MKDNESFDDLELVIRGTIAGVSIRRVHSSAYSNLEVLYCCYCSFTDIIFLSTI